MSPSGRSGQLAGLRAQIARIEGYGGPATSFGSASGAHKVALGRGLDRLIGGGLRRGGLTEVVAGQPGDAPAASGFALALAVRFAQATSAPVVWVIEDGVWRETGAPYGPGLAAHGLDPDRLFIVHTTSGADTLWATEEVLKCHAVAAVVTDLWRIKAYDLVASRRLVMAAGRSGTPGVLVAHAAGNANALSSAAQTRFEVRTAQSPRLPSADHRMPLPGPAALAVRLARMRTGPSGAVPFDWETFWPLVWDHEERGLCDALPLTPSALPRDRSHPATAGVRQAA